MTLRRCLFCLAAGAAEMRFDKRSRPYVVCRLCGTRCFVRNLEALRGLAIGPSLLDAAVERYQREDDYKRVLDADVARLVADVRSARPTEVESGLPKVMVEPFSVEKVA